MYKLFVSVGTALAGMGLAGFLELIPAEPQRANERGDDAQAKVLLLETDGEQTPASDPAAALRQAYAALARLRAEKSSIEGPPREWLDRALAIYREGIEAFEKGDKERARGLASAARELARAVDYSRQASRSDRPDPELPPPPGGEPRIVVARELIVAQPALPTTPPGAAPVPPPPPAPPRIPMKVRVLEGREEPNAAQELRAQLEERRGELEVRVRQIENQVRDKVAKEAEEARRQAEALEQKARQFEGQARKAAEEAAEEARKRAAEIEARARKFVAEALASAGQRKRIVVERIAPRAEAPDRLEAPEVAGGASPEAKQALKEAHDKLKAAIEKDGEGARFYLDSARNLYNAARRDATEGRNDRAIELARAAVALTLVPRYLGTPSADQIEVRVIEEGPPMIIEQRIEAPKPPAPPLPPSPPTSEDGKPKREVRSSSSSTQSQSQTQTSTGPDGRSVSVSETVTQGPDGRQIRVRMRQVDGGIPQVEVDGGDDLSEKQVQTFEVPGGGQAQIQILQSPKGANVQGLKIEEIRSRIDQELSSPEAQAQLRKQVVEALKKANLPDKVRAQVEQALKNLKIEGTGAGKVIVIDVDVQGESADGRAQAKPAEARKRIEIHLENKCGPDDAGDDHDEPEDQPPCGSCPDGFVPESNASSLPAELFAAAGR